MTHRSWFWCFTAHTAEKEAIQARFDDAAVELPTRYLLFGTETCPSTQRIHQQGYVEFKKTKGNRGFSIPTLSNAFPGWHWEPRRGTQEQAVAYIKGPGPITCHDGHVKQDFDEEYFEEGRPYKDGQGARNDLDDIQHDLERGGKMSEVVRRHFGTYIRYHAGLHRAAAFLAPVPRRLEAPPDVIAYIGAPGTGKSTAIRTLIGDTDYGHPVEDVGDNHCWWDGYEGQATVWLPDFQGALPFHVFKTLCDVDQVRLPLKHGSAPARPTRILIDSNYSPGSWYPKCTMADKFALVRRITEVWVPDPAVQFAFIRVPDPADWLKRNWNTCWF